MPMLHTTPLYNECAISVYHTEYIHNNINLESVNYFLMICDLEAAFDIGEQVEY